MLLHAHGLAPKGVTGARNSRVSAASRPPGAAPAVRIHANLPNGRRLTLRSTAASEQEASQAHQQDTAQVAPAVQVQGPWSDEQRDALWEAVPRALIKLGKAGAQESHVRQVLRGVTDGRRLWSVGSHSRPCIPLHVQVPAGHATCAHVGQGAAECSAAGNCGAGTSACSTV